MSASSSNVDMELLLNESWRSTNLPDIIKKQPDVEKFLGKNRDSNIIPKLENTFRALNEMSSVSECKVVIFGQDPYPREESAIGIAFYDGQIKKWTDAMSPSFRNIVKNVLIGTGHLNSSDKVETMRKQIAKLKLLDPPDWFEYTMKQNVLWLNTALTFSGTDKNELNKHTKFWAPIVEGIVETLVKESTKGLVFVLWGGNAKKLKTMINKVAKKGTKKVEFVEANHPAVESFNDVQSFTKVNEALKKLGHEEIDWLGTEKKRKEAPSSSSSTEDEGIPTAESSNKKAKK